MRGEQYLAELEHDGLSGYVRVFDRSGLLLDQGFGLADRATGTPNTAAVLFDIASIAKTFTAAAVLHLHDRQQLGLDDTLAMYFPDAPADKRTISVYQLLTHTSGLTRYTADSDFKPLARDQAVARTLDAPLRAEPGAQEQYGEANYALLAAIVEQVGARPFTEYVRTNLLRPLGLERTRWYADSLSAETSLATGSIGTEALGEPRGWPLTWAIIGAGGMLSTADDLTRWLQAIHTAELLSATSRRLLVVPAGQRWSAGWEVHHKDVGQIVLKGGNSDYGFAGVIGWIPQRQSGIVMLLNGRPHDSDGIHHEITTRLLTLYFSTAASR